MKTMPALSLPHVIITNLPGWKQNILVVNYPVFSSSIVRLATFISKPKVVDTTSPLT
jgi:hypothetical protein